MPTTGSEIKNGTYVVRGIKGTAHVRKPDGEILLLKVGDTVEEGDVILADRNAVEFVTPAGEPITTPFGLGFETPADNPPQVPELPVNGAEEFDALWRTVEIEGSGEMGNSNLEEGTSFVKTFRLEYKLDYNFEYARDINEVTPISSRHSRNPRVDFGFGLKPDKFERYDEYRYPFSGRPGDDEGAHRPTNYPEVVRPGYNPPGGNTDDGPMAPKVPTLDPVTSAVVEDGTTEVSGSFFEVDRWGRHVVGVDVANPEGGYGLLTANTDGTFSYVLNNDSQAVQALAEGERVMETFTVTVTDKFGRTAETTITITVTGANDQPLITVVADDSDVITVTESVTGTMTDGGTLSLTDIDVRDEVTSAVVDVQISGADHGMKLGRDQLMELLATGQGEISDGETADKINWTFNARSEAFRYLRYGEELTLTYSVEAVDNSGAGNDTSNTQKITVTIRGTNESPRITIESGDSNGARIAETDAGLSQQGKLTLSDVDISDRVLTELVFVSAAGDTNGLDDRFAEMMKIVSGKLESGEDAGKIEWKFDSGSEAFNYLKEGQELTLTYKVIAKDDSTAANDTSNEQLITITIVGTKDLPIISDTTASRVLTEDPAGALDLTVAGDVFSVDDLSLYHNQGVAVSQVKVGDGGAVSVNPGGTTITGKYGTLTINPDGTYSYTSNNGTDGQPGAVQSLRQGEEVADVFTIGVSNSDGTSYKTLTVNITGANDRPRIEMLAGDSDSAAITEGSDGTTLAASGTFTLKDIDVKDAVEVQPPLFLRVVSGDDNGISPADFQKMLEVAGKLTSAESEGKIEWTFKPQDGTFSYLAPGESITLEYEIEARDNSGNSLNDTSNKQTITITINGTNNAPVITCETGDSDRGNLTEGDASLVVVGKLTVTDTDISDTVSSVKIDSVTASGANGGLTLTDAQLKAMFSITDGNIDGATDTGKIDWKFDPGPETFEFLPAGESLVLEYKVQSTDEHGAVSNEYTVKITITGTNDVPVAHPDAVSINEDFDVTGNVILGTATGSNATVHNPNPSDTQNPTVVTSGPDVDDPDHGESIAVVSFKVAGMTGTFGVGQTVTIMEGSNTVGTIIMSANGDYTFTPAKDYSGDVPQITYTIKSSDNAGDTVSSTLDIRVNSAMSDIAWPNIASAHTDEDNAVSLGLSLPAQLATDLSERLGVITLDDIPVGAQILHGNNTSFFTSSGGADSIVIVIVNADNTVNTDVHHKDVNPNAAGVVKMTRAEFEALKILPPEDSSVDMTVSLDSTAYKVDPNNNFEIKTGQDANSQNITREIAVAVHPVTDTPNLVLDGSFTNPDPTDPDIYSWSVDGSGKGTLCLYEDKAFDITQLLKTGFSGHFASGTTYGDGDMDGSEVRWIEITGLPNTFKVFVGDSATAATPVGGVIKVELVFTPGAAGQPGTYSIPEITVTPPENFSSSKASGELVPEELTVSLHTRDDGESDEPANTPGEEKLTSVNIDLTVTPTAGDVAIKNPDECAIEDKSATIYFLKELVVTDGTGDGSGVGGSGDVITGIRVMASSVPYGWVIYDHQGVPVPLTQPDANPANDYYEIYDSVGNQSNYKDYSIRLGNMTNHKSGLEGTLDIKVDSVDGTHTATVDLTVDVIIKPVAEVVTGGGSSEWTLGGSENNPGSELNYEKDGSLPTNQGLTMNPDHSYTSGFNVDADYTGDKTGKENTYFHLSGQTDNFNLEDGWVNPDSDNSEKTYALISPKYVAGYTGDGTKITAVADAVGSMIKWVEGGVTKEVEYKGTPIKIPLDSLETVQFLPPKNAYGEFKIEVKAYTEDTIEVKGTEYTSTAISGGAELTGIIIKPVPNPVTFNNQANQSVNEDNYDTTTKQYLTTDVDPGGDRITRLDLHIEPIIPTKDPMQSLAVTLKGIPDGWEVYYHAKGATNPSPIAVNNGEASLGVKFDPDYELYLIPPKNESILNHTIQAVVQSTVTWEHGTVTYSSSIDQTNDITINVYGAPNDKPAIEIIDLDTPPPGIEVETIKPGGMGADTKVIAVDEKDAESTGIPLKDLIQNIELTDIDGSEKLTLKITNLSFSNGAFNSLANQFRLEGLNGLVVEETYEGGKQVWTITLEASGLSGQAYLAAIKAGLANACIVVPANYNGTVSVDIIPITVDGTRTKEWTECKQTATFLVRPTAEASIINKQELTEDNDVIERLVFAIDHKGNDTDEILKEVWILKSDLDGNANFTLYYGATGTMTLEQASQNSGVTGVVFDGTYYKLTTPEALASIHAVVKGDLSGTHGVDGKNLSFGIKYIVEDPYYNTAEWSGNQPSDPAASYPGNPQDYPDKFELTVKPVSDPTKMENIDTTDVKKGTIAGIVDVTPEDVTIGEKTITGVTTITFTNGISSSNGVPVDISVTMPPTSDCDGSERLLYVVVDGVPDGIKLGSNHPLIKEIRYVGDFDDTLTGDPNSAGGSGRWLLILQNDNTAGPSFTSGGNTIDLQLLLQVDGSSRHLWSLKGENVLLTVSACTQDYGYQADGEWVTGEQIYSSDGANLNLNFNFIGGTSTIYYPAAEMSVALNPVNEDGQDPLNPGVVKEITLGQMCTVTFNNDGQNAYIVDSSMDENNPTVTETAIPANAAYRFTITLEGLEPGTVFTRGGTTFTVDGNGTYTVSGYGSQAEAQSILNSITVEFPENFNDNWITGGGLKITCETKGYGEHWVDDGNGTWTWDQSGGGLSSFTETYDNFGDFVKPVTDGISVSITSTTVTENQAGETATNVITINLDNSADRQFAAIGAEDGGNPGQYLYQKVYVRLDADYSGSGEFSFNGSNVGVISHTQGAAGYPADLATGYYVVLDLTPEQIAALKDSGAGYKCDLELKFTPNEYWAGKVGMTAYVFSQEKDGEMLAAEMTGTHEVTVTAQNSGVTWLHKGEAGVTPLVVGDEGANTVGATIGERILLVGMVDDGNGVMVPGGLQLSLKDQDSSEGFTTTITITLPKNDAGDQYVVWFGNDAASAVMANPTGSTATTTTWAVTVTGGKLPEYIAVEPPAYYATGPDGVQGKISVSTGEISNGKVQNPLTEELDFDIVVNPISNGIGVCHTSDLQAVADGHGTRVVQLNLNAEMHDRDDSEIVIIRLGNLGPGAEFRLGKDGSNITPINSAFDLEALKDPAGLGSVNLGNGVSIYYSNGVYTIVGLTYAELLANELFLVPEQAYADRKLDVELWTLEIKDSGGGLLNHAVLSEVTDRTGENGVLFKDGGTEPVPTAFGFASPLAFSAFGAFGPPLAAAADESTAELGEEAGRNESPYSETLSESDAIAAALYDTDNQTAMEETGDGYRQPADDQVSSLENDADTDVMSSPQAAETGGEDPGSEFPADDSLADMTEESLDIFGEYGNSQNTEAENADETVYANERADASNEGGQAEALAFDEKTDQFAHEGLSDTDETDGGGIESLQDFASGQTLVTSARISGSIEQDTESDDALNMEDVFDMSGEGLFANSDAPSYEQNMIGESSPVAESALNAADPLPTMPVVSTLEDELIRQLTESNV